MPGYVKEVRRAAAPRLTLAALAVRSTCDTDVSPALVRMDKDIGPVSQVDRRYPERAFLVDVMVRAHWNGVMSATSCLSIFSRNQPILGTGAGSRFQGAGRSPTRRTHRPRMNTAWKRRRRVRHVQTDLVIA